MDSTARSALPRFELMIASTAMLGGHALRPCLEVMKVMHKKKKNSRDGTMDMEKHWYACLARLYLDWIGKDLRCISRYGFLVLYGSTALHC